jgi:hypothetical protein
MPPLPGHIMNASFDERFAGTELDPAIWIASYLPAWSSRAASGATYAVRNNELRLFIPPEQELWCPDLHEGPLRVSAVQSGNWSGPVGSTRGQSPFRDGLVVREAQETLCGFTPYLGRIEVTSRAAISPRSMFSAWMIGMEDEPKRSGEICIVEIFGKALGHDADERPTAQLGCGIHAFRDPALIEDFAAPVVPLDITRDHAYAVDWTERSVTFSVDGQVVRSCEQSPPYPMQLILGVFDFPAWGTDDERGGIATPPTPELIVSHVRHAPEPGSFMNS